MALPPKSNRKLVRLFVIVTVGAFLGFGFLGALLLEAIDGYDHGRGEAMKWSLVGALAGVIGGACFELALRLSETPSFRFSLRGLLIATTVIAAALGLIIYAAKF